MKTKIINFLSPLKLFSTLLLGVGLTARAADQSTLKEAYKDYFKVGVAINRTIATDSAARADNVNRNTDQVRKDTALVFKQFNQISPENDLKWQLIHPRERAYARIFRAFSKHHDVVDVVTFWGANHAVSWRAQGRPLLFDRDNQPKPAFDAVITEATKTSNPQ